MPRKPPVPTIPDKPSGRAKPEHSPEVPKHSTELSLDQFDLWDAFAASPDQDPAGEPNSKHRAKARQRRGSRAT